MYNILIDTGFWFALYDKRDPNYWKAIDLFDYLSVCRIIIPYPSLYETINTRFVRNRQGLAEFKLLLNNNDVHLLDDSVYKFDALNLTFDSSIFKDKNYSLVDMVIRLMLSDGIGNCLQQPGPIRNHPNVYHRNLHPLIKFCIP